MSISDSRSRQRCKDDFKRNVVQLFLKNESLVTEAAGKYEITREMLHKWLKIYGADFTFPADEKKETMEQKFDSLRKEVQCLKEEVGVLKEIITKAFLAKHAKAE